MYICSYIDLEPISGVAGTILLSIYSSVISEEKLFGDIICYHFSKRGVNKFVVEHIEDIEIEIGDLPSFKYISDIGTPFYMSGGRYLLMYATKVQDRNSIDHLNYFFIHSPIHIRFKIIIEYFKREYGMSGLDREKLFNIFFQILEHDKITKQLSVEEKRELIAEYLEIESTIPSFNDIPAKKRERVT